MSENAHPDDTLTIINLEIEDDDSKTSFLENAEVIEEKIENLPVISDVKSAVEMLPGNADNSDKNPSILLKQPAVDDKDKDNIEILEPNIQPNNIQGNDTKSKNSLMQSSQKSGTENKEEEAQTTHIIAEVEKSVDPTKTSPTDINNSGPTSNVEQNDSNVMAQIINLDSPVSSDQVSTKENTATTTTTKAGVEKNVEKSEDSTKTSPTEIDDPGPKLSNDASNVEQKESNVIINLDSPVPSPQVSEKEDTATEAEVETNEDPTKRSPTEIDISGPTLSNDASNVEQEELNLTAHFINQESSDQCTEVNKQGKTASKTVIENNKSMDKNICITENSMQRNNIVENENKTETTLEMDTTEPILVNTTSLEDKEDGTKVNFDKSSSPDASKMDTSEPVQITTTIPLEQEQKEDLNMQSNNNDGVLESPTNNDTNNIAATGNISIVDSDNIIHIEDKVIHHETHLKTVVENENKTEGPSEALEEMDTTEPILVISTSLERKETEQHINKSHDDKSSSLNDSEMDTSEPVQIDNTSPRANVEMQSTDNDGVNQSSNINDTNEIASNAATKKVLVIDIENDTESTMDLNQKINELDQGISELENIVQTQENNLKSKSISDATIPATPVILDVRSLVSDSSVIPTDNTSAVEESDVVVVAMSQSQGDSKNTLSKFKAEGENDDSTKAASSRWLKQNVYFLNILKVFGFDAKLNYSDSKQRIKEKISQTTLPPLEFNPEDENKVAVCKSIFTSNWPTWVNPLVFKFVIKLLTDINLGATEYFIESLTYKDKSKIMGAGLFHFANSEECLHYFEQMRAISIFNKDITMELDLDNKMGQTRIGEYMYGDSPEALVKEDRWLDANVLKHNRVRTSVTSIEAPPDYRPNAPLLPVPKLTLNTDQQKAEITVILRQFGQSLQPIEKVKSLIKTKTKKLNFVVADSTLQEISDQCTNLYISRVPTWFEDIHFLFIFELFTSEEYWNKTPFYLDILKYSNGANRGAALLRLADHATCVAVYKLLKAIEIHQTKEPIIRVSFDNDGEIDKQIIDGPPASKWQTMPIHRLFRTRYVTTNVEMPATHKVDKPPRVVYKKIWGSQCKPIATPQVDTNSAEQTKSAQSQEPNKDVNTKDTQPESDNNDDVEIINTEPISVIELDSDTDEHSTPQRNMPEEDQPSIDMKQKQGYVPPSQRYKRFPKIVLLKNIPARQIFMATIGRLLKQHANYDKTFFLRRLSDEGGAFLDAVLLKFNSTDDATHVAAKLNGVVFKNNVIETELKPGDFDPDVLTSNKRKHCNETDGHDEGPLPKRARYNDGTLNKEYINEWGIYMPKRNVIPVPPRTTDTFGMSPALLFTLGVKKTIGPDIFVHNIHEDVTEEKLREVFSLAGHILSIPKIQYKFNNSFARIVYEHPVEALQAVSMFNGQKLYGLEMRVTLNDGSNPLHDHMPLPDGLENVGKGFGIQGRPLRAVHGYVDSRKANEIFCRMGQMKKIRDESHPFEYFYKPTFNKFNDPNSKQKETTAPPKVNVGTVIETLGSVLVALDLILPGTDHKDLVSILNALRENPRVKQHMEDKNKNKEALNKYIQKPPQLYTPNAPPQHRPNAPRQHRPNAPQQHRPNAPQQHRPNAPQQYRQNAPQQYTPNTSQQYTPNAPQQYTPTAPQQYTPNAPQQYTPNAPQQLAFPGTSQQQTIHAPSTAAPNNQAEALVHALNAMQQSLMQSMQSIAQGGNETAATNMFGAINNMMQNMANQGNMGMPDMNVGYVMPTMTPVNVPVMNPNMQIVNPVQNTPSVTPNIIQNQPNAGFPMSVQNPPFHTPNQNAGIRGVAPQKNTTEVPPAPRWGDPRAEGLIPGSNVAQQSAFKQNKAPPKSAGFVKSFKPAASTSQPTRPHYDPRNDDLDSRDEERDFSDDFKTDLLHFKNLPQSVNTKALTRKMEEVGEIIFAEMTGNGRALVRFKRADDARRCIRLFDRSKVDGHVISVSPV